MSVDLHAGAYVMQKRDKRRKKVGWSKIVHLCNFLVHASDDWLVH